MKLLMLLQIVKFVQKLFLNPPHKYIHDILVLTVVNILVILAYKNEELGFGFSLLVSFLNASSFSITYNVLFNQREFQKSLYDL